MTTFILNMVQSVFKPAVVTLSVATGVAIMAYDDNPARVGNDTISLSALGCGGLLSPVCNAFR